MLSVRAEDCRHTYLFSLEHYSLCNELHIAAHTMLKQSILKHLLRWTWEKKYQIYIIKCRLNFVYCIIHFIEKLFNVFNNNYKYVIVSKYSNFYRYLKIVIPQSPDPGFAYSKFGYKTCAWHLSHILVRQA